MSEREEYSPGVPCWVETLQPDPWAAMNFYRELFSWDFVATRGMQGATASYIAQLRGRDVGAVCPPLNIPNRGARWIKHVRVTSVSDTARTALAAGGQLLIEPFEVAPGGRMAILSDPAGATFAVAESSAGRAARLVNESQAWALSTLRTSAIKTAEDFYRALFGWKAQAVGNSGFSIYRLAGYFGGVPFQPVPRDTVAGMQLVAAESEPSHWEIDFWVDDVDGTAAHASSLGGIVMVSPQDTGLFRYAMIADPQGAVFTVSKMIGR
ncbi:MAG TPA: VOC family protein [Candidatus Dormibacteraeota bacterium]|nr:VOC family protein [Candidatus Dormibacteraeota bacterium]